MAPGFYEQLCIEVTGLSRLEQTYCAKHNQHAKHAKARGSGGIPPDALRLNLRVIFQEFKLLHKLFYHWLHPPPAFQVYHFVLLVLLLATMTHNQVHSYWVNLLQQIFKTMIVTACMC